MFDSKILGNRVRELRIQRNINQIELGNALGVVTSTINRIESGKRALSVELLVALANYFHVSIDYLVGRSDDPHRH